VLYSCDVDISATAPFGSYPVTISDPLLVAPPGVSVLAVGNNGAIIVGSSPTSKDDCKNGGWRDFSNPRWFKGQGDCIQYVNTGREMVPGVALCASSDFRSRSVLVLEIDFSKCRDSNTSGTITSSSLQRLLQDSHDSPLRLFMSRCS
jgi:hypothetical protein